jgi:hypothetical protein
VDGQEIGLVAQLRDQAQLVVELFLRAFRDALGVAPVQPLLRQPGQPVRRTFAIGDLGGVFVPQRADVELQPRGDLDGAVHGLPVSREDAPHLGLPPQTLFGIGLRGGAEVFHPQPLADAGQDVGQPPPRPVMHQRPGGGGGLHAQVAREPLGGTKRGLSCPS